MGWLKLHCPRTGAEMVNPPSPAGRISGAMVVYGDFPQAGESLPRGDRLKWNTEVVIRADDDRPNLTKAQQKWRRHHRDARFKLREIPQRRQQEWRLALYREVKDIAKDTRPTMMMYE